MVKRITCITTILAIDVTETSNAMSPTPHWNDKYQRLLSKQPANEEAALRKDVAICSLIGTFAEVATAWAKRIVDNHHIQPRAGSNARRPMTPGGGEWIRNDSTSDLLNSQSVNESSHGAPPSWLEGEIFFHFVADYEGILA